MAEPFLDLGDVGLMRERVGGGRGAQGAHAEADYFGADAGLAAVSQDDVVVDRTGIKRPVESRPCGCSSPSETRGRRHRRRRPRAPGIRVPGRSMVGPPRGMTPASLPEAPHGFRVLGRFMNAKDPS